MTPRQRTPVRTTGARASVRAWFLQPHDYAWMTEFQNSHPTGRLVRLVLGITTINFGIFGFAAMLTFDGRGGMTPVVFISALTVLAVIVGIVWLVRPFPGRWGLVAFTVFADIGTASSLSFNALDTALLSCVLFSVIGTFVTYFLSPRWVVAHLVFSTAVIGAIAIGIYVEGTLDLATLLIRTNIVLVTVGGVAVTSHLFLTALSADARSSLLDPLTGLLNRRGLDSAIGDVWNQGRTAGQCVAVLVLDIDNFKRVNDRYGHEEGDRVIRRIAHRLTDYVQKYGVLGRVGGEEYLVAVVTSRLHIDALIHGVRRALQDDADSVPVTVSIGAAILYWDSALWADNTDTITLASRVADSLMYEAKAAGGNRVVTTLL